MNEVKTLIISPQFYEALRMRLVNILRSLSGNRKAIIVYGDAIATDVKNTVILQKRNYIERDVPATLNELLLFYKSCVAHEGSHIRFTSLPDWMEATRRGPVFQHLTNIIEDGRIEAAISEYLPGAGQWIKFNNQYVYRHRPKEIYGEGLSAFMMGLNVYSILCVIPPFLPPDIIDLIKLAAPHVDIGRASLSTANVLVCVEKILEIPEVMTLIQDSLPPQALEEQKGTNRPQEFSSSGAVSARAEKARKALSRSKRADKPEKNKKFAGNSSDNELNKAQPACSDQDTDKADNLDEINDAKTPDAGSSNDNETRDDENRGNVTKDGTDKASTDKNTNSKGINNDGIDHEGSDSESCPENSDGELHGEELNKEAEPEESEPYADSDAKGPEPNNSQSDTDECDIEGSYADEYVGDVADNEDDANNINTNESEIDGSEGEGVGVPYETSGSDQSGEGAEVPGISIKARQGEDDKDVSKNVDETVTEDVDEHLDKADDEPTAQSDDYGFDEYREEDFTDLVSSAEEEVANLNHESREIEEQEKEVDFLDGVPATHASTRFVIIECRKRSASYQSFKQHLVKLINDLTSEIQTAIETKKAYHLTSLKRGRLHSGSLWKLTIPDPGVFSRRVIPGEIPELAVYVLVDCSGSMSARNDARGPSRMEAARAAACVISETCRNLKIPHAVTGFNDDGRTTHHYPVVEWDDTDSDKIPALIHGTANRDGFSLRIAANELMIRPEPRKLLLMLSDGLPVSTNYHGATAQNDVKSAVFEIRKKGIRLISLHFGDKGDVPQFLQMYDTPVFVPNLNFLPRSLGEVFKKVLLEEG